MSNPDDPTLQYRLATLTASGFDSESEMAEAVLCFVNKTGRELIASGKLSEAQQRGIASALNDAPIAVSALTSLPLPEAQKQFVTFALAKLIDDMLNLGATAKAVDEGFGEWGKIGGGVRAKQLQDQQKKWQEKALTLAKQILEANARLTGSRIAERIIFNWDPNWGTLPKKGTVRDFVYAAIREGNLQRLAVKGGEQ